MFLGMFLGQFLKMLLGLFLKSVSWYVSWYVYICFYKCFFHLSLIKIHKKRISPTFFKNSDKKVTNFFCHPYRPSLCRIKTKNR